jgi:membrane protein implicated in regulation of membrane protease activity
MDIAAYISANHAHFFYILAGLSFLVELTLFGLSGPLLFFAIASFVTAVLISIGLISGWEIEIFTLGVLTAFTALLLWKPLKRFQNSGDGSDNSSDMIGRQVPVSKTVSVSDGSIRYSGINWNSRLADDAGVAAIHEGELCIITSVDGNIMLVKPLAKS